MSGRGFLKRIAQQKAEAEREKPKLINPPVSISNNSNHQQDHDKASDNVVNTNNDIAKTSVPVMTKGVQIQVQGRGILSKRENKVVVTKNRFSSLENANGVMFVQFNIFI